MLAYRTDTVHKAVVFKIQLDIAAVGTVTVMLCVICYPVVAVCVGAGIIAVAAFAVYPAVVFSAVVFTASLTYNAVICVIVRHIVPVVSEA